MRTPRTLEEFQNHPYVSGISDERGMGDGIWIYLVKGYVSELECGVIHEHTVKECSQAFKSVHLRQ